MGPRIGALELGEVLGEGGQGRVHRARHRRHAIDVAVKVWAAPKTRGGADSFRSEARLAAGLDHPNVVSVLDFGTVTAEDAAASQGALAAGQPYLVMELFEGATLSGVIRGGGLPWHEALPLLEALFAGVAHAHARGVLHRDIKPSNVLLDARSGRVALTDFGVACALGDDVGGERLLAGSPHFMAPEQVTGSWRDWSPSTDLYALGCVAWLLLTGRPPHDGATREDVLLAQLHEPLPPFRPRVAVPPALEAWLATLLAKAPEARFQRAADAAWHLGQLGAATRPSVAPSGSPPVAEASSVGTFDVTRTALDGAPVEAPVRRAEEPARLAPAPCPDAPPELPRRARPHVHAGLGAGVFGLRELPLVGRAEERRRLWEALKRVHGRARAELVLVRGAAGVGKSKLARWLAETAHAAGAATVLAAVHGSPPGAMDGLGPMLARWAGALGAGAEEARAQAARRLEALPLSATDRATLAAMVVEAVGGARLPTQRADRFAALVAFLGALSEGRPVVLWLDDLQWGWEALQLAERVLEAAPFQPMRVLLLGTVREEALLAREDVAVRLDALAERAPAPRAASLQLGPLDARERSALVQELLGLEGELAARVEERSGGNPLFAVQLVGDWIARGCLALGRRGFELTEAGAAESLPRDLGEMWEARVRHALDSAVPEERWALELAATLGHEVDRREWRRACAEAGVAPASRRVADWFERRLIVPAEGGFEEGWSFVHGMLREALLAGARRAGRLASHHAACAAALGEAAAPDRDERRGLHLRA
ncbi:MAG TPA: protein kinase, partial [Polyangiaceae bacterium LLY-WYZ-15_(1-7)]|nr:protein kinase [Polyangiaceae bacterium LLY-WYZ-15_(1-7)]